MNHLKGLAVLTFGALTISACGKTKPISPEVGGTSARFAAGTPVESEPIGVDFSALDTRLAQAGRGDIAVAYAEYLTLSGSDAIGRVVFASNRGNKQMPADWVAADPRRGARTNITTMVDRGDGAVGALTSTQTTQAIHRATGTWNDVACSTIPIDGLPYNALDLGVVEWLLGFGGVPAWFADLTHAGWLPKGFFDALAPPSGGDFILAVTLTFVYLDGGELSDIDNDGKIDVALREIYYNDDFNWRIDSNLDVETIALHEIGHGLSQAHFGEIFRTVPNGKFHFSPRAVMNAVYTGVQQALTGTDEAGHCSIWADWPSGN